MDAAEVDLSAAAPSMGLAAHHHVSGHTDDDVAYSTSEEPESTYALEVLVGEAVQVDTSA